MQPSLSIVVDAATSIVRITMAGFFEQADIDRFLDARNAAHAQLRCGPNQHLTLVDVIDMKIQSKESVATFARVLGDPMFASRHLAFAVGPTLARAQIQRAAASRAAMFFPSLQEAEQWLKQQRSSSSKLKVHPPYGAVGERPGPAPMGVADDLPVIFSA